MTPGRTGDQEPHPLRAGHCRWRTSQPLAGPRVCRTPPPHTPEHHSSTHPAMPGISTERPQRGRRVRYKSLCVRTGDARRGPGFQNQRCALGAPQAGLAGGGPALKNPHSLRRELVKWRLCKWPRS
jgi:hypothetical protein